MIDRLKFLLLVIVLFFGAVVIGVHVPRVFAQPSGARTVEEPILYVYDSGSSNPFARHYLPEILKTEGINLVTTVDRTSLPGNLQQYSVIIVGETTALSTGQISALTTYVQNGGMVLVLKPQDQLNTLLNSTVSSSQSEGYLKMEDGLDITEGLTKEIIQYHGDARQITPSGSVIKVASLYSDSSTPTSYAAASYYQNGEGIAAQIAFDPAKSIALLRQGNPAWKDQDSNGDGGMRPLDLFINPEDNNEYWNDLNKLDIPQADEQMRLLSNMIYFLLEEARTPVPKFWYFPDFAPSVVISTGDDHLDNRSASVNRIADAQEYGGTTSIYYRSWPGNAPVPTTEDYDTWVTSDGMEMGIHPYYQDSGGNQAAITAGNAQTVYDNTLSTFIGKYGANPGLTVRNHFLFWTGYTTIPLIQANAGFRMNFDYYPCCQLAENGFGVGTFTGSSLPMRYVTEGGELLNIYQQETNWSDETWPEGMNSGQIDRATMPWVFNAVNTYNTAINGHAHIAANMPQNLERAWDYAVTDRGLSLRSGERWYKFWNAKNTIAYNDYTYDQTTGELSYSVVVPNTGVAGDTYTMLLPTKLDTAALSSVSIGGSNQTINTRRIRGREYAYFNLTPGTKSVVAGYDFVTITNTFVVTQDTYNDFSSCTFTNTNWVKTDSPGIELQSSLYDDFDDNTFDASLWDSQNWVGGAWTPTIVDGVANITDGSGAWMRSKNTYTREVIEFRANYSPGSHKNIGFSTADFGNEFITFKAHDAAMQYISLSNLGGPATAYTIPFNEWRTFKLDNTDAGNQARWYVNNSLEYEDALGTGAAMYVYFSNTDGSVPRDMLLDWVKLHDYPSTTGTYQSCTIDAGSDVSADALQLDWRATEPAGTNVTFQTRTSTNGSDWSGWSDPVSTPQSETTSEFNRYVQYRINASGTNSATPTVHSVAVKGINKTAPVISNLDETPASTTAEVEWDTNIKADGLVEWGLTSTYNNSFTLNTFPRTLEHAGTIGNLSACSTYNYKVTSVDGGLNTAASDNEVFTTTGCAGNAAVTNVESQALTTAGGEVSLVSDGSGVTLDIPNGYHNQSTVFQIHKLVGTTFVGAIAAPTSRTITQNLVFELRALTDTNELVTEFDAPITVTFQYTDEEIENLNEETLEVWRWDGSEWHELSCSLDTAANALTCTTEQFSTFTIVGQTIVDPTPTPNPGGSSASGSRSHSGDDSCSAQPPGGKVPQLYAVTQKASDQLELYYTPSDGPLNYYMIEYGLESGKYNFGGVVNKNVETRTFVVGGLQPGTQYYFRVRAGNGCAPGGWSNELSGVTPGRLGLGNATLQLTDYSAGKYPADDTSWMPKDPALDEGLGEGSAANQILGEHTVHITVLDTNKQPISDAKVTLHSTPREAVTNESGEVEFKNVEAGEHTVVVEHKKYSGEQKIYLTKDAPNVSLEITVTPMSPFADRTVQVVLWALGLGLLASMALLLFKWSKK